MLVKLYFVYFFYLIYQKSLFIHRMAVKIYQIEGILLISSYDIQEIAWIWVHEAFLDLEGELLVDDGWLRPINWPSNLI